MHFPLYHRPNSLVFLDDDASYLEMLALVMPDDWSVRFFTHVDDCLAHFEQQHGQWETDVWQHHALVENWRAGKLLIPEILEYWTANSHRYGLAQCCVVDFAMPAMTGVEFLKKLPVFPASRVLLTGKADEQIAIAAFNEGLISKFVPKQQPDMGKHLTAILSEQHQKPMDFHEAIWRSALKKEQHAAMREPTVQLALHRLAHEKKWVEYVVLPAPFGILALDTYANAHWLQLELRSDLASAADLAQSTGQSSAVVQKIRQGSHFVNTELLMAMGSDDEARTALTFDLGFAKGLLGAFFPLVADKTYGTGHSEFLARLPSRAGPGESQI
jgi:CheY-like chemotaxis protein